MRVLACGSRTWLDQATIEKVLDDLFLEAAQEDGHLLLCVERARCHCLTLVEGGQRSWDPVVRRFYGADYFAGLWAESRLVLHEQYPADWARLGKRAGFVRNAEMVASKPDVVVAFWEHGSRGTQHTMDLAKAAQIPTRIIEPGYCPD